MLMVSGDEGSLYPLVAAINVTPSSSSWTACLISMLWPEPDFHVTGRMTPNFTVIDILSPYRQGAAESAALTENGQPPSRLEKPEAQLALSAMTAASAASTSSHTHSALET